MQYTLCIIAVKAKHSSAPARCTISFDNAPSCSALDWFLTVYFDEPCDFTYLRLHATILALDIRRCAERGRCFPTAWPPLAVGPQRLGR